MSAEPNNPTIKVDFTAINSAQCQIAVENCSSAQIGIAVRMLDKFADGLYNEEQRQANSKIIDLAIAKVVPPTDIRSRRPS